VRPGEKLVEELCNPEERVQPTAHASIVRVLPPPLTREELDARLRRLDEMLGLGREPEAADALLRLAGQNDVADLSAAGDTLDLAALERSGSWSRSTT